MKYLLSTLLILGVSLTQFYLFSSGLPQLSHMILSLFIFLSCCVLLLRGKVGKSIYNKSKWLLIFVFYTFVIDILSAIIYNDYSFLINILYFVFNLLLLLSVLSYFGGDERYKLDTYKVSLLLLLPLALLAFLSLFKIGRTDFYPRFNAFFNDPNQMAFWAICLSSCILHLSGYCRRIAIVILPLLTIIILSTQSRSGLIGFTPLAICMLALILKHNLKMKMVIMLIVIMVFTLNFGKEIIFILDKFIESVDVINRFSSVDLDRQLGNRGYERIFEYYQYILFGAGKGAEYRFNTHYEIHSTWVGVLFYYGFVGFSIFIYALNIVSKGMSLTQVLCFLSPLLYSFTTYGLRTPIFWFFIGVFCLSKVESRGKE